MKTHPQPLTSQTQLLELCSRLNQEKIIAFDTEFLREKTYWPHICLIQVATPTDAFLVDTLAPNISLSPLIDTLNNPLITKIVHAGTQDFEGLFALSGHIISNIADTQIMARFCSTHYQSSLDTLLQDFSHISLEKNERMSDWSLRPLTPQQCQYALSDVTHLHELYHTLSEKINNLGRQDALTQEIHNTYPHSLFTERDTNAWQKIKTNRIKPYAMPALKALALFREQLAIKKNIPRQRVLSDNAILAVAQNTPKSIQDLAQIRNLHPSYKSGKNAQNILDALAKKSQFHSHSPSEKINTPPLPENISNLITVLLHTIALKHHIAPRLIASSHDIRHIAAGEDPKNILAPWQFDIFGKTLLDFLSGHISIGCKNNKLTLIPTPPPQ